MKKLLLCAVVFIGCEQRDQRVKRTITLPDGTIINNPHFESGVLKKMPLHIRRQAAERRRREEKGQWQELPPSIDPETLRAIRSGRVHLGMTKDQVRASWYNWQIRVNRTITEYGTREQWVCERDGYKTVYLYFEGDKLITIQD